MITNLYTILDIKSAVYNTPFTMLNHDVAKRACMDLVQDASTQFSKHPADYTLFHLGTYEDTTAKIKLNTTKEPLFTLNDLYAPESNNESE